MNFSFPFIAARAAPVIFVFFWCTGFIFSKLAQVDAEPMTTLAWRMALTVPVLAIIALVTRAPWPDLPNVGHSVVAGLLVQGLYLAGVFVAIGHGVPAGLSALIPGLQPVLTSTLASRWLGERVSRLQWTGLALGLLGVLLVLHDRLISVSMGGDMSAPGSLIGWGASIVSLAGITIGTLYQKRYCGGIDWRTGNTIQNTASFFLYLVAAYFLETGHVNWTPQFIGAISYLAVVLSVGTIAILYWLIRNSAATQVASLFYLVPGVTALMAYILFDEKLDPLSILGMAICAAGVFLVNWRRARV